MAAGVIPYGRQSIDEADIAAVVEVLRGDWLTQGPNVSAFETSLAERVGARHAVAVSNGTATLHIACMAADLGPGDAAIVPSMTFLSTANAARFVGAEVIFADVDPDTGLMSVEHAEAAADRARKAGLNPKVLMPVHFAGQSAPGVAAAQTLGLTLIEDAAHAIGTTDTRSGAPAPVGACEQGGMASFSFHPVKTIATGEGGAVTTSDDELARRLRLYRSHGMVKEPEALLHRDAGFDDGVVNPWYYEMQALGFNYRLTDLQSALGVSQLTKLDRFVDRRLQIVDAYDRAFSRNDDLLRPIGRSPIAARTGWHLYIALIDFERVGMSRREVMAKLRDRGVGTQVHYIPVHTQPYYVERYGVQSLPGAEAFYDRCLSLPLYPAMTDEDVRTVTDAVLETLGVGD